MKIVIEVIPRTKKNSQSIVIAHGRPIIIPSKYFKQFEKECDLLIPIQYRRKINVPVNIKVLFFMKDRRRVDLTNLLEAVDDMLVTTRVLEDDNRNIVAGHDGSRVFYDKDRPRLEIEITRMEEYETWKKT